MIDLKEPTPEMADESLGEGPSIGTDEMFALLSNERRRRVLQHLSRNGGEARLRDLARDIAAEEHDAEPVDVTYAQRKRLYTSLYQSHLPRMERSDVITYDRNSGVVALGPAAEEFDVYLEIVGKHEFTWSTYYLGLATLFGVATLAFAAGTPPFAGLQPAVLMSAYVALLAGSAIANVLVMRTRRL